MQRAKYPGIATEETTVSFEVMGLKDRPSLRPHVAMLLTQRISTLKDLKSTFEILQAAE